MMHVRCRSCGAPKTVALTAVDPEQIDLGVAGVATLPRGTIVIGAPARTVEQWARGDSKGATVVQAPAGSVVVHPEDLVDGALLPVGSANGCCGLDGQDGPNQGCACGAVLGTAWTDCWTANEVRFLPEAVQVAEAD